MKKLLQQERKTNPIKKSSSDPIVTTHGITKARDIFSPHRLEDKTTPPGSIISLYRTLDDNNPYTMDLPDHAEELLQNNHQRLLKSANEWLKQYFELARQSIESGYTEASIQAALTRLKVYLGPPLYKIQMQYRESHSLRQFQRWKVKARFELWGWLHKAVLQRKNELQLEAKNAQQTWFASLFPSLFFDQSLNIIQDEKSRHEFLQNLVEKTFPLWRKTIHRDYEKQHIDLITLNLIHRGYEEEKVRQLVKYPLSSQFAEFLENVGKDFCRYDCVIKFSNSGNLQEFADEIKRIKQDCEVYLRNFDINAADSKLVENLSAIIANYETSSIELINNDLKVIDNSKYYKNQGALIFVKKILRCLNMQRHKFKEEDYIIPLANLVGSTGKNLIEHAILKYLDISNYGLREKFFEIIKLLYEYGSTHELAFGRGDGIRLTENPIHNLKLEWELISLQISTIPIYNEFEGVMKKILSDYCKNIPELFEAGYYTKAVHDWHGLKRSQKRLHDVQELAYALLKASLAFDDSKLYITFMILQERIDPQYRVGNSALFYMTRKYMLKPVLGKNLTYFGEMAVDSLRGVFMTTSRYAKLQDDILELLRVNAELNDQILELMLKYEAVKEQLLLERQGKTADYDYTGLSYQTKLSPLTRQRPLKMPSVTSLGSSSMSQTLNSALSSISSSAISFMPSRRASLSPASKSLHIDVNKEKGNPPTHSPDYLRILPRGGDSSDEDENQSELSTINIDSDQKENQSGLSTINIDSDQKAFQRMFTRPKRNSSGSSAGMPGELRNSDSSPAI